MPRRPNSTFQVDDTSVPVETNEGVDPRSIAWKPPLNLRKFTEEEAKVMFARRERRSEWTGRAVELMESEVDQRSVALDLVEEFEITEAEAWYAVGRARDRLGWTIEEKKKALQDSAIERAEETRARASRVVQEDASDRSTALQRMIQADDQLNKLSGAYEPDRLDVQESKHEIGSDEALKEIARIRKQIGLEDESDEESG